KKQYFIDSIKSLVDEHSILTLKLKEINKFDVRQFIQKKESLNGERKVLELKKIKYEEDKVKLIKNYSLGLFGHDLSQQVIEELNDKDKLGSLPAPYDESLINQLEEAGSCICGRELIKGTKPYEAVLALRNKADNAEIKHRRLKAVHFAGSLKRKPSEFISEYNRVFDGLKSARSRIVEIDAEISEVEKMILSSPDDEIRKTQAEIKSREQRISDLKHKEVQIESLRPRMEAQLAELKKDISRYQPDDKFNSDIHRKIEFIKRLKKTCSLKLEQHEKDAVKEIAKKVNETLDKFSRKDFKIRLSTDYQFFLTKADGEPLAKSKGENLLLNLSFISSLISFCKQRVSAEGNFLIKGTVAPFFIDAPFGELDETYREATAQFLPESCEQLILLLSSSHWKGKVSSAIDSKIGKEYVLVSHKTYDKGEKPDDTIDIKGLKVNQSVYNSKFDGTVVEIV
ncbi:hypothetical protein, partial [Shewanella xiamenensis]|uniref:hypothetical protein n=1 Tax=Shewanella xiamenensis TaxID=332186 RepID=UPI001558B116